MHLLPLLPGESLAGDEAFRKAGSKERATAKQSGRLLCIPVIAM